MTILLEPFTPADIDRLIGWVPTERALIQWSGRKLAFPLDDSQLKRHLADGAMAQPPWRICKAADPDAREVVGHGELINIHPQNRSGHLARILVGPDRLRGRGIGEQIAGLLLRIAFEELSLHRVSLNVFDFNAPAIRCYEKLGFAKEGVLRDACKVDAEYWNTCVMGILEEEWKARRDR